MTIDETDQKGVTPLIVACQYGMTMLAAYLIGKGAGLQLVDSDGDSALHWAAFKGIMQSIFMRPLANVQNWFIMAH